MYIYTYIHIQKYAYMHLSLYLLLATEWISDANMFKSAMRDANIDVDKMPLGNISPTQVAKGFKVSS